MWLGLRGLTHVPWDSPGSSLGVSKPLSALQSHQPALAPDANLLHAETPPSSYAPKTACR